MNLTDLIRFQVAHSAWALEQLIRHAQQLPEHKIEEDLGIGPGGLRANLAHTIECMFFFADNFAGRKYTEPPEFAAHSQSIPGLKTLLIDAEHKLKTSMLAACAQPESHVSWPNAESGTMPAAAAIAQVFDHSTLHRTQCINMLKRLGVRPVPDLDPMTFQAAALPW